MRRKKTFNLDDSATAQLPLSDLSLTDITISQVQDYKYWRRERDSNPRYPFRHSGFQDHPFQPLTHPSALRLVYQQLEESKLRQR